MNMKRILLLLLLFLAGSAQAANWYVRPNGGAYGTEVGTSWTNAYDGFSDITWASIAAGDTIWVAGGTYTGALNIQKTASSGSPIAIRRARSDAIECTGAAGWSSGFDSLITQQQGSMDLGTSSWIIISGRTTASGGTHTINPSRGARHGWLMTRMGLTAGNGIEGFGASNITVEYLELEGAGEIDVDSGSDMRGIRVTIGNNANWLMANLWMHDWESACYFVGGSGHTFEYGVMEDIAPLDWVEHHPNGIITWSTPNCIVRYSTFRKGPNGLGCGEGIFFEQSGGSTGWQIYGNLFYNLDQQGWKGLQISGNAGAIKIYNNTFDNNYAGFSTQVSAQAGTETKNNIFSRHAGATSFGTSSNNLTTTTAGVFVNRAAGDYQIVSTTGAGFARNAGTNLGSPYNVDMNGVTRGIDGTWDIGAYEYNAGGGDPIPAIVSYTINAAGTQITLVFSEAVTVGGGGSGGFALTMSGGAVTMSSPTGSGTTRTYTLSRLVAGTETGTISYTQPGNGYEDSVFQDVASFSGQAVSNNSTVAQVAAPSFSPAGGSYFGTQNVIMTSSTPGATIRYTTDGTDPTASSTQYTAGVTGIPTSISTNYRAKAFASGLVDSNINAASYELGTWTTAGTAWKSFAVPQRTGSFTWLFRASASTSTSDVVIGLSPVLPSAFTNLGPTIRFEPSGIIDARNGGAYAAVNNFTYVGGTTYEFVVTINVTTRTYSATVAQIGGSPVTIANNYAFRSEQSAATQLSNFGANSSVGAVTVSQMSFGGAASIPTLTGATIGASGTTLTLGFSEAVVYGTGGNGGWTISASGGAATLTPTANPTTFTVSRPIAAGETGTISYTQPNNGVEAVTGGGDLATLTSFAFNNQSTADLTAPIPNPMTFSAIPIATSSSSVTMTASVATDASTPPVQYYFDETSGNPGGNDSGWTTQRTYTNNGLSPGIQYTYRVLARDSAAVPNQTTPSSSVNVTTPIVAGGKVITPAGTTGAGFFNP